jgi:hypothetical protein
MQHDNGGKGRFAVRHDNRAGLVLAQDANCVVSNRQRLSRAAFLGGGDRRNDESGTNKSG